MIRRPIRRPKPESKSLRSRERCGISAASADHRKGIPIHVAHDGGSQRFGIVFLHGWPESWATFGRVMESLSSDFRVVALDLPGIGESTVAPPSNDKRTLAGYVREVIHYLDLQDVSLFGYFFDTISAKPGSIAESARQVYVQAYSSPGALRTGFEWYRAFRQDERDNSQPQTVRTPVPYLRGGAERGLELGRYVEGWRASGLTAVEGKTIPNSGHFAPDEAPEAVVRVLRAFLRKTKPCFCVS